MIMYTHAFNSTKNNKPNDAKETKDERLQTAFLDDLMNYCNEKDPVYKSINANFTD